MSSLITNALGQTLDLAEARRVADVVRAVDKQCWHNSLKALRRCYRGRRDVRYVEGHALHVIPTEHGWLEVGGHIVDPTPVWQDAEQPPLYFPGLRYTAAMLKGISAEGFLPAVHRNGRWWSCDTGGAYRASLYAAHAHAFHITPAAAERWLTGGGAPTEEDRT